MGLRDEDGIKFNLENRAQFNAVLTKAFRKVSDLRFPFGEISRDFYKSQRAIFLKKGPGFYRDLSPKYKIQKARAVGFIYPILRRGGDLERATTSPNAKGSINIIRRKELIIGASLMSKGKKPIDYVEAHNSDAARGKLPQRKVIFIGPEVRAFQQKDQQNKGGRLTRWSNSVEKYVESVLAAQGFA